MEITVHIPDQLAAQAEARGVRLETYVEQLLAQQIAVHEGVPPLRTPEAIRHWLDALAQFSDKVPPLPETISRDWLYQDHD